MGKRSRRKQRLQGAPGPNKRERQRTHQGRMQALRALIKAIRDTSVTADDIAPILLDLFSVEQRQDERAYELAKDSHPGRVAEIARAFVDLAPDSLAALTFAAGAAEADGDHALCAAMYERAIEVAPDEDGLGWLLEASLVEAGRVADGVEFAEKLARADPAAWDSFEAYRDAIEESHSRRELSGESPCSCGSGDKFGQCCKPREAMALIRFHDPGPFDEIHLCSLPLRALPVDEGPPRIGD